MKEGLQGGDEAQIQLSILRNQNQAYEKIIANQHKEVYGY